MDASPINVLSCCSGIGGLDLGIRLALPDARTVGYLENEAYACAVLAARIADGFLDDALERVNRLGSQREEVEG